ncbi:probable methyltransferase-like protein 24 [Penaeus chinensis]|uniref:probable methyltransferase-like protein 24 n=1 Tax=Penaeus chinensis TaxID=139456 RepID=UPI001FB68EC4|nr:probable methyltransferase-like protein 24 [Penaeus chinensis]
MIYPLRQTTNMTKIVKMLVVFILFSFIIVSVFNHLVDYRIASKKSSPDVSEIVEELKKEVEADSITKAEDETACSIPGLQNYDQFFAAVATLEAKCNKSKNFGGPPRGTYDAQKSICVDERFKISPNNCIVFSFGINNDFSFEDDMADFGCKVYAYDPTMKVNDHQRSPNVWFFATGISNYQGLKSVGMDNNWIDGKVDRFENLVKAVGMEGRPIDVVKLDVELAEVDFLQDLLFNSRHVLKNIKQIAMEIHSDLSKKSVAQITSHQVFWPYLHLMRCAGFKLIASRSGGIWREVVWASEREW